MNQLQAQHDRCRCFRFGTRFAKWRCPLVLSSGPALSIDCDECLSFGEGRKPDLIVLQAGSRPSSPRWLVVEIKTKGDDANRIVEQLQAGADHIANSPAFSVPQSPSSLTPLVLHSGKGFRPTEAALIAKRRIRFRGQNIAIRLARCGVEITE